MKTSLLVCAFFLVAFGVKAQDRQDSVVKPFDIKNYDHLLNQPLPEVMKTLQLSSKDMVGRMKQVHFPQVNPNIVYQVLPLQDGTWLAFDGLKLAIVVPPQKR